MPSFSRSEPFIATESISTSSSSTLVHRFTPVTVKNRLTTLEAADAFRWFKAQQRARVKTRAKKKV